MTPTFDKVLLCSLAIHVLGITAGQVSMNAIEVPPIVQATCSCAAFKDKEGMGEPILSKTLTDMGAFKITCTDKGKNECIAMCINLAMIAKERVVNLLCEKLPGTVDSLKPAAFYKICDDPKWTYADFSAADPICCEDYKKVTCKP